MTFVRPTLTALIDRILGDQDTALPGADSRLRRSVLGVLGRAQAGAAHGLHGHLDWIARQVLPDTADADQLDRHAAIWGVTRKAASVAAGVMTVAGTEGAIVPAETILQRLDGQRYRTIADAGILGGFGNLSVDAIEAGPLANAAIGIPLTFVSPVSGVQAVAVAVLGLAGGAAGEEDAALRARLLQRIRTPPRGGAASDWTSWALEVPGVTRAWSYPNWTGPGTVGLTFVFDGRANILPGAAELATMAAYIDARRPVCATPVIFASAPFIVDLLISAQPISAEVRAAIVAELVDLFAREAEPGGTIRRSHLDEAVSAAAGETDHTILAPVGSVVSPPGALPTLGQVTWA